MTGPSSIAHRRTLRGELERQAQVQGDKTWLIFEASSGDARTWSYGRFRDDVYRAAHLLLGAGIRPGDKLLLHLGNCPEFLILWFAAASIRAVIVPTNPISAPAELEYLCEHSEAVLVVVGADAVARADDLRERCPRVRNVIVCGTDQTASADEHTLANAIDFSTSLADMPATAPDVRPEPDDDVAVMYTSGTTSKPKGCLITNVNYVHVGEAVAGHMSVTPQDRLMAVLPLFHGNAQYYCTMTALVVGASLVVGERFSASRYFLTAARHGATVGSMFSAPLRMLLAQPREAIPEDLRMRLIFFAQNLTPPQLREWDERFGVPLLQIYGMTEQLGHPLANPLYGARDNMTIGRPTLAFRCRLVGQDGADAPMGVPGELLVSGEPGVSLMRGYFKDPAATAATLRDGWLHTGDNVRMRQDGFFEFVDRAKDMIKRAGENVAASEVEAVIKEHPAVYDAAVVGVPDPIRDEAIKAFVVLRAGATATSEDIIQLCAERLARFRVPQFVEFRDELPRTSVGKIQKHLLRAASHPLAQPVAPSIGQQDRQ